MPGTQTLAHCVPVQAFLMGGWVGGQASPKSGWWKAVLVAQLPACFKIEATALLPPLEPDVEGGGEDSCTKSTGLLPEQGTGALPAPGVPARGCSGLKVWRGVCKEAPASVGPTD